MHQTPVGAGGRRRGCETEPPIPRGPAATGIVSRRAGVSRIAIVRWTRDGYPRAIESAGYCDDAGSCIQHGFQPGGCHRLPRRGRRLEGVGSAGEPSRGRKTAPKRLGTRGRWRESDSHKPCGSTSRRFVSGARSHCGTARPTGGCHRRPGSPQTTGRVARERREANVLKNRGSARRRWLRRAT